MSRTLVIAEKPSVGKDLAGVLPGPFTKGEGYLESDSHVITWAVGHLVQLAEPDEYDPKFKKWRMADLPIVPDRFKLVVRDERSRKQMSVITRQLKRSDVETVVNACDAGREGELIFAYVYEKAGASKPVKRLWLSSMTKGAIRSAFSDLRPSESTERLEQAARSRSEADWIVGMNATRAATIRLRSSFDGAGLLGRVQTPTLAIVARREEEIRAFKPEPYWLVDARFEATSGAPGRTYAGRFHKGASPGSRPAAEPRRSSRRFGGQIGEVTKLETHGAARARAHALRPHDPPAGGQHPYGFSARGRWPPPSASTRSTRRSPTRVRARASDLGHGPGDQADRRARGGSTGVRRRAPGTSPGSTCCRCSAWSTTRRWPTTTRSSPRAPSTSSTR
jgi:DNA topoisomerase-3